MMKQKANLVLRKIGNQYLIVDTRDGKTDMSDVYCMNETAAMMWTKIGEREYSVRELAEWMEGEYDVDMDTAVRDVEAQVEEWKKFGLIEQEC